ncbi:zeta toxin family protein [Caminibacter pacificus]|uniref:ABC-type ATPase n=1 Tax=Caminibacter pacificus TaxID=1424653 RepID=A0AAJ4RB58_9BACT|nr:zeta toxin family protein [Caminibacter pacificus]QDD68130.1 hypothetical protein C6V80_09765 [Caminibacter pacificus]ROR38748.1 putative ABC-type ATPase [Caminibacter pacificus]
MDTNKLFQDIVEFFVEYNTTKNKIALFKGGLPGAGKSTSLHFKEFSHLNPVIIDVDEIRKLLPNYTGKKEDSAQTQKTAGLLASMLRNYCIENGYDYMLDSTLSTPQNVAVELSKAKKAGYKIYVKYLYVSLNESLTGVLLRYYQALLKGETPRFVDYEYIKQRYKSLPEAMAECINYADNVQVLNRRGEVIIDINNLVHTDNTEFKQNIFVGKVNELILRYEENPQWDKVFELAEKAGDLVTALEWAKRKKEDFGVLNSHSQKNLLKI